MKECCANCRLFYEEYGMEFCKKHEEPEENISEDKCSDYDMDYDLKIELQTNGRIA